MSIAVFFVCLLFKSFFDPKQNNMTTSTQKAMDTSPRTTAQFGLVFRAEFLALPFSPFTTFLLITEVHICSNYARVCVFGFGFCQGVI